MLRVQKVRLYPNENMKQVLDNLCAYRRYCWNQGLALWNDMYEKRDELDEFEVTEELLKTILNPANKSFHAYDFVVDNEIDVSELSDIIGEMVSAIANNYNLNPETTRVIMNANFAIIYDTREDSVVVGDILYNTSVNLKGQQVDITDKVAMQIRMAIEQIGVKGKKFDISRLDQEQLEMCSKAMNLNEELDVERGISHGAR